MRRTKRDETTAVICSGHALVQNLRRGHNQLGGDVTDPNLRLAATFDGLLEILE